MSGKLVRHVLQIFTYRGALDVFDEIKQTAMDTLPGLYVL